MAGKITLCISVILYVLLITPSTESSKLNVPRVLLPIFSQFSINFTLEATNGGCYKWTTSRLDLVQLTPLYDDSEQECSSRAIVSSISKETTRNTAIVLAEEQYTGQVLRCDVIVDVINSLGIVTTTRELYMEEAPEAFEARAYDDQGNEFTTLQNVQFDWMLTCTGSGNIKDDLNVLRFMTFRDSPYETPKSIEAFEEKGLKGHIVLLEGIKTGSAKVSLKLPYPEYVNVKKAEVSLMVVANLIIEPADVYILRGDTIQYRIIQVKHGRLEQIELSSSQYYLKVDNEEVGTIDKKTGYFTGLKEGKTKIVLHDINVDSKNTDLKLPSTTISVTFPDRMALSILPNHNWAILIGETHELSVELFTKNDHKIYLGQGVQFETTVDESLFPVFSKSSNGSWLAGQAKAEGSAKVSSKLISLKSQKLGTVYLEPTLSEVNEILIFPPIILHPNEVVFPWDPQVQPKYEIQMRASGGDGKFIWSSTNHTVGTVTQVGLARTYWHGIYEVCASMCRNTNNKKCSKFYIVPPTKLEIVEYVMENEIGAPIFLQVALFAERPGITNAPLIPFTQCGKLDMKVKPSEYNFVYNKTAVTDTVGISCRSLAVVGLNAGTSRISVSYIRDGIKIEDNVTVSTYRRLEVLHPENAVTVLALGTSRNLIFSGGPRPWMGRSSEHSYKFDYTNNPIVKLFDRTDTYRAAGESDMYVVRVSCKEIGESQLTLTVANKPLFQNCKHQSSTATVTVYCSNPYSILLQPDIKTPGGDSCPMDVSADRVVVQSYRDIRLGVSVKDDLGRTFDNITSFKFDWVLSPLLLGSKTLFENVIPLNTTYENIILPAGHYQSVVPQSQAGTLEVTAKIIGYIPEVLKQNDVKMRNIKKSIQNKISLYLVDDTIISPNITSVYNHAENKYYINVKQGSGFYDLSLSTDNVADIKYLESKRQIEVTPQSNGELRVSLKDLCLKSEPAVIVIRIVSVAALNVVMPDKVQLGKTIKAIVKFYDESDNLMPLPNLDYLDIRYIMEDDIVTVKLMEENPKAQWPVGEVHYLVRGQQLGDTQIVFAAGRGDKEVVSEPVSIQVFSPIKLVPKNTTLFIGAELQLSIQGGPQPDANIEYLVQHENVIEVSHNGLVKANALGTTKVVGRSIGICPSTGEKMVHGQDVIDVNVIPLTGIKIVIPLTRFIKGAIVPAWITGLPEPLSPIILASVQPPFNIEWVNQCEDIVDIYGIFKDIGIKYKSHDEIAVRLKGIKPGRCTLGVDFTIPGATAGSTRKEIKFSSSIDLEVFEEMRLTSPTTCGQSILLAPYSSLQLTTNLEEQYTITYSLQDETFREDKSVIIPNTVISVSETGLLQSFGIIGRAMVIITAVDNHGLKQSITLVVQVKPIHYMMTNVEAEWTIIGNSIPYIPLGAELKFFMTYHDNTGATFTSANVDLRFRSNRFDLVDSKRSVGNGIISYTVKPGSTMTKVWAEGTQKTVDYVNIVSEKILSPSIETLNSGDVFCFRSPVVDKYWKHGMWYSDDNEIVRINSDTGIGQVVTETATTGSIFYSLTSAVKMHFNIEPIKLITLKYEKTKMISNYDTPIVIPFLLSTLKNKNSKKNNIVMGWPCEDKLENQITYFPFKCEIFFTNNRYDVGQVFIAEPDFNSETGLFSCNIARSTDVTPNTSVIESNVTLIVVLNNGIESEPIDLVFKPSVYIFSDNLVLSDSSLDASLSITGLTEILEQIKVIPMDSNLLEVSGPTVIAPNTISYDVKLIDYHWKFAELHYPLSVTVVSKATNQNIKVMIKTLLGQDFNSRNLCMAQHLGSPTGNFFYNNRHALTIILSMLILFFLTVYAYSHYIQPVINVNVGPSRTLLCSPNTQLDTSPLMLHSTPTRSNRYCNTSTCPSGVNRSVSQMNSSMSGSPRFPDTSQDMNRSFNTSDIRRNRRFL